MATSLRTEAEIRSDLDAVRAAKRRLLLGQQAEEFTLHGRQFRVARVTYADLVADENRLIEELQAVNGDLPTFLVASFPGGPYR